MKPRTMKNSLVLATAVSLVWNMQNVNAENGAATVRARTTIKAVEGPLADYVAKPDASYGWTKIREGQIGSTEYAELILTSQHWRDVAWKHRLFVIKPSTAVQAKRGVLVIAGGRWKEQYEDPAREEDLPSESKLFAMIAEQLKSPVAVLLHVPQQPLFDGLVEDEIISLTFDKYLSTEDPEWPLLLPMVKSAVRGMDAVQEYCQEQWSLPLESFTVTGASKRGWTTWLVGAIDQRATAIAPMVIDTLNMHVQMKHQIDAWGVYSEQIEDYSKRKIQQRMETAAGRALRDIVDPFSYRQTLNQPKLIFIGTNDRYWPLDALNLYWDDLTGPKYISYIPNNGHGLKDFVRIVGNLAALHADGNGGPGLPAIDWSFARQDDALTLRVQSDRPPEAVNVWLAKSEKRDFRDSLWQAKPTTADGETFVYKLPTPSSGYAAMFGELRFRQHEIPYYLSTNVQLISAGDPAPADAVGLIGR